MNPAEHENHAAPNTEMEAMLQALLDAQLALGQSLSSTSQFLRFVLNVANENLGVIRTQLESIRDLALRIDEWDCAS